MTKEKSQADLEIEALSNVFNIATTGFQGFYEEADRSNKGYHTTAASSGDHSKAASSGYYSKAASSGDRSTAASSGMESKAASSGYRSKAASSGDHSTAASSGIESTAASSGYYSKAASSGDHSTAASSGYYSKAASSGDRSTAASSGRFSACAAVGYRAAVKGEKGNLLMASEYIKEGGDYIPVGGRTDIVDGKKLKPNCWYIVEGGEWVEVDFSDNIFSYVLSVRGGVKKVKTDNGDILYVVSDDAGNCAHGKTIKQAREDLAYKAIAEFDGEVPAEATGKEWVGIYRAITGACGEGIKMFVQETGKSLDDTYTAEQIAELIKGRYGSEKFLEVAGLKN